MMTTLLTLCLFPWIAAGWPSSMNCDAACMATKTPGGVFGRMGVTNFELAAAAACAITTNIPTAGYDQGTKYVVTVTSEQLLGRKVALGATLPVLNVMPTTKISTHEWVASADASTTFRAFCGAGGAIRKVWVASAVTATFSGKKSTTTTTTLTTATGSTSTATPTTRGSTTSTTTITATVPKGSLQLTAGLSLQSTIVDDNVDIVVTSDKNTWVSIGFASGDVVSMIGGGAGSDVFACTAGASVRRYSVTAYATPSGGSDVAGSKCERNNGKTIMTFRRTLAARRLTSSARRLATVAVTPGKKQTIIWAFGNDGSTGFSKHSTSSRGGLLVDLKTLASSEGEKKSAEAQLYLHLIFMTLSWGALLPWGVALANRTRNVPGQLTGAWFRLHRAVQSVGWFVQILGFIAALWHVSANVGSHFQNGHTYVGLVVVILGTMQPLNAFVRPHPKDDDGNVTLTRKVWEVVHKGGGYLAILFGQLNIWFGVKLLNDNGYNKGVIILAIVLGLLGLVTVVGYFILAVVVPNNGLSRLCVGARSDADVKPKTELVSPPVGHQQEDQSQNEETRRRNESME